MTNRLSGIDPRLYFVTDSAQCARAGRSVAETAAAAVAGGAGIVQVRDKTLDDDHFYKLVKDVSASVEMVAKDENRHIPVVVNDRVTVAQRLRTEGIPAHVHVGQDDANVESVRRRLGKQPIIGVSAATPDEFAAARASRAVDLVGVGPAFDTSTKPDAAASLGVDQLARLVAGAGLPAVAIGGIDAQRAEQLRGTGVVGVCVVSAICLSDNPQTAAAAIYEAFSRND